MSAVLDASNLPALSGKPLYALIDPYFREPQPIDIDTAEVTSFDELQSVRAAGWGRDVWVPRSEAPLIDPLQLPYLVALDSAGDPWCSQLAQLAAEEAAEALQSGTAAFTTGTFIESDLAAERLMQRIESMWRQPVNGETRYLRIADPRGFEMLSQLIPEAELRHWLGPIHGWHVRARSGRWMRLAGFANDDRIDSEADFYRRGQRLEQAAALSPRLAMNPARVRRLQQGQIVARVLNQLPHNAAVPAGAHEAAWTAIEEASRLGLADADDLVAYACRSLANTGFRSSPMHAPAIAAARARPGSLAQALEQLEQLESAEQPRPTT